MRTPRPKPFPLYVAAVSFAGLGLLLYLAVTQGPDIAERARPELWLFLLFLVAGELLPIHIPRQRDEIVPSTGFTYAILLAFGLGAAVIAQALASVVADAVSRKPIRKSAFNAAQYTLALGASGFVLQRFAGVPHDTGPPFATGDIPVILLAALVFFFVNGALTGTVVALSEGTSVSGYLRREFPFQAWIDAILLSLAPIVVVAAEFSALLVPLLALPLVAVYRAGRQAVVTEHQAFHDGLTDLPNRTLFRDRVQQALFAAEREGRRVAVMLMDLDRFKEINDTLGHHHGDMLLGLVGPRLRETLRESDTVARLGGDEFAVLLPHIPTPEAGLQVARKVIEVLERPFVLNGLGLEVGASIGIAFAPEHGDDVDTLLQRADVAMYLAKESRSGYEVYSPEQDQYSPGRLALVGQLRRGIAQGELVVLYQPQVDLHTGTVRGAEALVRWRHPEHGFMSPDQFIPLAEHTGLIRPVTSFVLDESLRQVSAWRAQGLELMVSVNLAVSNLVDRQLPTAVRALLERWNVPASCLQLEITEGTIMADPPRALVVLEELSAMGVGLSIDDFGTGYSSLAYLKRLPVNEIKIDRSFVMNMGDEKDAVIVRSTIDLGRNLGLSIVAEGVEDQRAFERLGVLGCDVAQGFHLSRPVEPDKLTRWAEDYAERPRGGRFERRAPEPA